jgi:hypothetical protein
MLDKTIEVQHDPLNKTMYTFRSFENRGNLEIRLIGYQELRRENTRKRIYTVLKWYSFHNERDRYQSTFIPVEQIELPQAVKDAYIQWVLEGITFITTERKR